MSDNFIEKNITIVIISFENLR